MRTISSLVGALLFLFGTIGVFILLNGNPYILMAEGLVFFFIFAPLGSSILAFGFRDVLNTLFSIRFLFFTPPTGTVSPRSLVVTRFLIISVYAIGGLFFLFCIIINMASLNAPLGRIGQLVALSLCSLMYPIFISEGLLRPLKYRLEYLAEQKQ